AMCLGEPTQGAPTPVLRRAAEVTRDGTGLGYSPIFGIPELREAIDGHYRNCCGMTVPRERIAVTTGASGAFQTKCGNCCALGELVDWCREHGVQVISDEIYHGISYIGTRGECALAHDDDAIVISSFSKYWGMTGWRLGWAILPEPLVAPAQNVTGNLSLCAPVPAQYAAVAGFTEESYAECEAAVASFAGAREHVLSASRDLGFGEMAPPDGAFYMYTKIDEILDRAGLETSGQWCEQVLDATGVALAPGDDFDSVDGSRAVRLSLAVGADRTAEAIDRILDWLE